MPQTGGQLPPAPGGGMAYPGGSASGTGPVGTPSNPFPGGQPPQMPGGGMSYPGGSAHGTGPVGTPSNPFPGGQHPQMGQWPQMGQMGQISQWMQQHMPQMGGGQWQQHPWSPGGWQMPQFGGGQRPGGQMPVLGGPGPVPAGIPRGV